MPEAHDALEDQADLPQADGADEQVEYRGPHEDGRAQDDERRHRDHARGSRTKSVEERVALHTLEYNGVSRVV